MKIAHIPYILFAVLLTASLIVSSIDKYDDVDYHFDPDRQQTINKVDVNTAGLDELQTIPGVGAGVAQNIVEFRTDNGDFHRVEDLLEVPGIGPSTFSGMLDYVTVGE